MPLHTYGELAAGHFDALDYSIFSESRCLPAFPQLQNCLVVGGGNGKTLNIIKFAQDGTLLELYDVLVKTLCPAVLSGVLHRRIEKSRADVLNQTAARSYVQKLHAGANAEYGKIGILDNALHQPEIEIFAHRVRQLHCWLRFLTISGWAIVSSADQHDA